MVFMKITAVGGDARVEAMLSRAAQNGIATGERGADVLVAPDMKTLEGVRGLWRTDAARILYAAHSPCEGPFKASCAGLMDDGDYVDALARLTAEGAVVRAGERSRWALMGARCAVTGFGRIARALVKRLMAMEARVTVAARRAEARMEAEAAGAEALPMEEMASALDGALFVWNTVPSPVISPRDLSVLPVGAVLMDLASPPYGFDLDQARRMGITASRERGLPGRYCPQSAGSILFDAVLRHAGEAKANG